MVAAADALLLDTSRVVYRRRRRRGDRLREESIRTGRGLIRAGLSAFRDDPSGGFAKTGGANRPARNIPD
jgi:hypothetical protein